MRVKMAAATGRLGPGTRRGSSRRHVGSTVWNTRPTEWRIVTSPCSARATISSSHRRVACSTQGSDGSSSGYTTSTSTLTAYCPRWIHRIRFSRRSFMRLNPGTDRSNRCAYSVKEQAGGAPFRRRRGGGLTNPRYGPDNLKQSATHRPNPSRSTIHHRVRSNDSCSRPNLPAGQRARALPGSCVHIPAWSATWSGS